MCVFSLVKVGYMMLESLRKIGMIEMPKVKLPSKCTIDEAAKKEAMRLLRLNARVKDIVEITGIHRSSILRYQSDMKQAARSKCTNSAMVYV